MTEARRQPSDPTAPLRVAVANALSPAEIDRLASSDPRLEVIADTDLLPPQRFPGDFAGDPAFVRSPAQQTAFEHLLKSADILFGIPDLDPSTLKGILDSNPKLRWVHTMAAGGGSQIGAAGLSDEQLQRVTFTTSAGVHARPLAEFALLGLLAGAKSMPRLLQQQHDHRWTERWHMGQLSSMTVLLVGYGSIGREIASILHSLGTGVIATTRRPVETHLVDEFIAPSDIASAAGRVDAIVVSLPGTAATTNLVDRKVLEALRPGATLVNVGRGSVVEHTALVQALRTGHLGFAALDVVANEPLSPDDALWNQPNVLISPHTAALTVDEGKRIIDLFAVNARRLFEHRPLLNTVDTVEFY